MVLSSQNGTAHSSTDETMLSNRDKRGLINFGGEVLHTIFGLATDSSVEQCRRMLRESRIGQAKIVHRLNDMVMILNTTYDEIDKNRARINEMSQEICKLIPAVYMVRKTVSSLFRYIHNIRRTINFERALYLLESNMHAYVRAADRYFRQKASLELGRLTEELLPPDLLLSTLKKGESVDMKHIEPLQWYYEHVRIYSVWGSPTLIYKVASAL